MKLTSKGYYENQIVYVVIMPTRNRNQTVEGLLAQHLYFAHVP